MHSRGNNFSLRTTAGGLLLSLLSPLAWGQLSAQVGLTSDYVWRGSSQSRQDPALQAGLRYQHGSGLYASAWASSVRFGPDNGARSELDLAAGWSGTLAPHWVLDSYVLRYQYPGAGQRLHWNELNASLAWRDHYWLAVGHSDNAMASGRRGTHVQVGARYPFSPAWRMEAMLAHYLLDHRYADSYTHAALSMVWAFKLPFEARLTVHGSNAAAKRLFPGMAGSRAELAVTMAF